MQRPTGITITAVLMFASIGLGLVALFTLRLPQPTPQARLSPEEMRHYLMLLVGFFSALEAFCVFYYWKGVRLQRWLVMAYSLYCLYYLVHLKTMWNANHLSFGLSLYNAALAVFLLWYLNTPEIRAWFAEGLPTRTTSSTTT